MENREPILRVEHLCQYFKVKGKEELKAVDDVSFSIHKGEVFGLVGESGCGKTTTGRSIIKLYDITSGNIWFKGRRICAGTRSYGLAILEARKKAKANIRAFKKKAAAGEVSREEAASGIKKEREAFRSAYKANRAEIKSARADHKKGDRRYAREKVRALKEEYAALLKSAPAEAAKKKREYASRIRVARKARLVTDIQMIFQDPIASLNPRMTVREIISEGLVIQGIKDKAYIDEKVYEVLELVGLVREHAGRYPHEFSGGQRQRIGVARSVIMRPDIIIADEPVSALDVSIRAQVINLLNELKEKLGLTILFIAHDLSVVKYFSDRIGVMYYGKLVEVADSDELFKRPLHPYTRSLLSAIPRPDPIYEKKRRRIVYNPVAEHDYAEQPPTLREILPGHVVLCNDAEFQKYQAEIQEPNEQKRA